MKILGLSFDFHDAAAALLVDDEIVFAAEEERFSRIKHDRRLPRLAGLAALRHAGLGARDLDAVVFYENPIVKFGRIHHAVRKLPNGDALLRDSFAYWLRQGKFSVERRIAQAFDVPADRVHLLTHHQSHAASAFFCSDFDEATVVTIDGIGEYETASVSLGRGTRLEQIDAMRYPDSLGLFYSAMTAFLGFEVNEGEYKVMGMAGFGQPRYVDDVRRLIFDASGNIALNRSCFDFSGVARMPFTVAFTSVFGEPRQPESAFDPYADSPLGESSRHYADLAASVQRVTEEAIVGYVRRAIEKTGVRNLALAGGVALNSLANGRIQQELGVPLYVHPSPGDAGGALGAALYHRCVHHGLPRPRPLVDPLLGTGYGESEILAALAQAGVKTYEHFADRAQLTDKVASLLAAGLVIGWFQGRFEWGPRALGARSILANPANGDMKRIINEKIKFREPFRPFAPAVLAERATEFFEMSASDNPLAPENFMLSVRRVRPDQASRIPAVTHVDGTGRVQLVPANPDSPFRALIERFEQVTGLPVILNTSFNRRGEPIVASPQDALKTYFYSGLDALVMGNVLIVKAES